MLIFNEKVQNEISMTSRNGLHKLPIVFFGITQKPFDVNASKITR